jgi:hypothetical protein
MPNDVLIGYVSEHFFCSYLAYFSIITSLFFSSSYLQIFYYVWNIKWASSTGLNICIYYSQNHWVSELCPLSRILNIYLEFQMMNKVQKPSDFEYYTIVRTFQMLLLFIIRRPGFDSRHYQKKK